VVSDVHLPTGVYLGNNVYSAVSTITRSAGSVSLADQNAIATWTPALAFGVAATGMTYTTQVGRYTVHGRLVTAVAYITINDNGSATGSATITGLPYTATNVTNLRVACAMGGDAFGGSLAAPIWAEVVPNTTTAALFKLETGTKTALTESDLANGTNVAVTLQYFV
jgi:hypothetical protein